MPTAATLRVAALTALGLVLRLAAGFRSAAIARDGGDYLRLGQEFLAGHWREGLAHHYPPMYPLWLALGGWATGRLDESVAACMSAIAGAAVIPAVMLLAARACGRTASLFAGLLAALLPLLVGLGGEVLADSLHLALVAWGLVLLQHLLEGGRHAPLAGIGVAALLAAAYLTRPEALGVLAMGWIALLVLPRPAGTPLRRRLADALWVASPALVALIPFLILIMEQETIAGSGGGSFKLTRKQDLPNMFAALSVGLWVGNAVELARLGIKSLGPGSILLGVAALRLRAWPEAARRFAWLALLLGAPLFGVFAAIRPEVRFLSPLLVLALPLAGLGAAQVSRWLGRRPLALALLLTALCLPFTFRPLHKSKASYRDAGALLAKRGVTRVLARDSRAGFYANAKTLPLITFFPHGDPSGAAAIAEIIARERPDAVVLVVSREAQRRLSLHLSEQLGIRPERVQRPGAVALDVFVLKPSGS